MSEAPVIFKRKSKPTQRARQQSPTEPDNADDKAISDSPSTLAAKLKKRAKPKARLSFGGDDEEGGEVVFKVKKSNLSQKLSLGRNTAPSSLSQTLASNDRPTYDANYLSQLKASTPSSRPQPTVTEEESSAMNIDGAYTTIQTVDIFETDSAIPAEATIKNAKEKRERLRTTDPNDDFISLSVTRRAEDQGPHPESRLVREEDELGEGDDEFAEYTSAKERIALGKKSRKAEANKRRDAMQEMIADAEEEDDETMEWEQEQLRRGGHIGMDVDNQKVTKRVYKPSPIPTVNQVPSLPPALARLAESLAQLTLSHAQSTASLDAIAKERQEVDEREKELRDLVDKAELKRSWFGAFHGWVEGVASFLDEKYPQLEKLEEAQINLLKQRQQVITERRRSDDEDDYATLLGRNLTPVDGSTKVTDEFGRDTPPGVLRRERRAARLARRARRRAAAEEEGYSTDSSLAPQEYESYQSASSELADRKAGVLSDVRAAEFKDPAKSPWWGEWRDKYGDSYVGAWGGLGLVGAWEFWVRLEIVGWDVIQQPRGLDAFKWYKSLYDYSRPGDPEDLERDLGPDGDLVSAMVSTAIIPRICKIIENGALDVYSSNHIRRIIDLAEEIEISVERTNAKFQMLVKSVYTVFEREIDYAEELMARGKDAPPAAPSFDPESIPARSRFLARRIKLVRNLLRWRKFTGEVFGAGAMVTRLVDGCIRTIAESGWEVGGSAALHKVVQLLPQDLISMSTKRMLNIT